MRLMAGQTIVFMGDSITDSGRNKDDARNMGNGYPSLVSQFVNAMYPDMNLRFVNRGISGDRVRDLAARWEKDCLSLNPDWVSIMIGINDTWRRYDQNDPTNEEDFYNDYRSIVQQSKDAGAHVIIMEPFLLNVPPERRLFRVDLDPKIQMARSIAQEFADVYIPLDGYFAAAAVHKTASFWAADGIHPTDAGHALIARKWMSAVASGVKGINL